MKILILIFALFALSSCANKNMEPDQAVYTPEEPVAEKKYSSTPNYINTPKREYKRTTKKMLSREAKLQQEAGSLWVMQGQGGFYFAQNNLRLVGDLINVNIDGEPKKELDQKVETIAFLLRRLEERRLEFEKKQKEQRMAMLKEREDKENPDRDVAGEKQDEKEQESELANFKFDIKQVPTRIKEKMYNGNYRVEGSKGFLIADKEYRVIINGIARAEDIAGDKIASSSLIEASFDIVSTLRKGQEL